WAEELRNMDLKRAMDFFLALIASVMPSSGLALHRARQRLPRCGYRLCERGRKTLIFNARFAPDAAGIVTEEVKNS
ncbi:hypothetical protein ACCT30_15875, partial [Rhizobium ruizarguesonis]